MAATLHFEVDTSPMARTVDSVRGHVNGVAIAVTAMEAAVIAAEQDASRTICENVDNGFYILVKSQISQKAVAAYSEMNSKAGILTQLLKALDNIRNQMQADFNMICRRYNKLFQSLNKSLETRIKELDRPAMRLAEIKSSLVFDRLKNDSSMLVNAAEETISVGQFAIGGRLKQKTRDTMRTLYDSTVESRSYNEKLESILMKQEAGPAGSSRGSQEKQASSSDYFFLPVVVSSTESLLRSGEVIDTVYTAQAGVLQNPAPIVTEVKQVQDRLNWTALQDGDKEQVKKEFISLCESGSSDERLNREMIRLFDESSWEVLQHEL
ncbi:MAG: hypothetical protein LBF77_08595 [Spirochaetaceae bacterium]|jgi:hypothetical protein|nr:hypothetical protein [Spirochaetaceae bacterium]